MKMTINNVDAENVIKRMSDLRQLSLQLAYAGFTAGLFKIDADKYSGLLPAEYEILTSAAQFLKENKI